MKGVVNVGEIVHSSTVDWPKKVVSVVFFKKCQLRCPWCHNPDLIEDDKKRVVISDVVKSIVENRKLIDGVVLTGGEPTLQKNAITSLCYELQNKQLNVMLGTNGIEYNVIDKLVKEKLIQRIAIDFKAPLDDLSLFQKITNTKDASFFDNFKKTLKLSKSWDLEIEYRTTIIPGLNSDPAVVEKIVQSIPKCDLYTLQQFRSDVLLVDKEYNKIKSPSRDELYSLGKTAKKYIQRVMIKTKERGDEYI